MEGHTPDTPLKVALPLVSSRSAGWCRIPFPLPAIISLRSAGSLRSGTPERASFLKQFSGARSGIAAVRQIHSRKVVDARVIDSGPCADVPEADGLVTSSNGPVLGVTVADCMPIYLYDSVTGAYGLLHSGWRGTGILKVAAEMMIEEFGSDAADLVVALGPCISNGAYEVDRQRAADYSREWGPASVRYHQDRYFLDLRAANLHIAEALGIGVVTDIDHCTFGTEDLGSYRREGADQFTSMLALVGPLWRVDS